MPPDYACSNCYAPAMARWFRRKALGEDDLGGARTSMIAFAIFNLIYAAMNISETQA
jgi:hypothetical protein